MDYIFSGSITTPSPTSVINSMYATAVFRGSNEGQCSMTCRRRMTMHKEQPTQIQSKRSPRRRHIVQFLVFMSVKSYVLSDNERATF